ncbi:aldehyde dehydrogenase family protein [Microbacterium sp. A204]|uniref:aldehyde dehydrogenase family protein n=1 Tax=Microbacterium sp. A204 TaxID=3457321 RepID=UPI003FD32AEA
MGDLDYTGLVAAQRSYYLTGATRSVQWRKAQLHALATMVTENSEAMYDALWHDLRRNRYDADLMDVAYSAKEALHALRHIDDWMKPERVPTPVIMEPGHTEVRRDPLGVTLIIGAWNEPFMLTLAPLVAAIAGGNTAVIKPSEVAVACSKVVADMIPRYLDPQAFAVVEGAVPETTALLEQNWDLIFFTGSPGVGKIIHQAAAKQLTPVVLELGGKNPTVVHSSADLRTAARRIAYMRYINAGHICTAPDHVLIWPEAKDEFLDHLKDAIREFYGEDPQASPDFGRVINERTFDRLAGYLTNGTIVVGGQTDRADRYVAPTVLVGVSEDDPVMKEEIFGPILPVIEVASVDEVIDWVNRHPEPLGLYVFSRDEQVIERILDSTESGDAVVNDCALQPLIPELPFGGVGNSGMGKYHGRFGFEAFTNARGVLYHAPFVDPDIKYPPYGEHKGLHDMIGRLAP